jgi:hypothetical protein
MSLGDSFRLAYYLDTLNGIRVFMVFWTSKRHECYLVVAELSPKLCKARIGRNSYSQPQCSEGVFGSIIQSDDRCSDIVLANFM